MLLKGEALFYALVLTIAGIIGLVQAISNTF